MCVKYKNSPIVEAFCGFQFDFNEEDLRFDLVKFNSLYETVKNDFPYHEKINIHQDESICIDGIRFSTNDKKNIILKVSPILLSINMLQPYSEWDDFFLLIKNIFQKYHQVFNIKKIINITLGYLNEINIPYKNKKIEDYFNFYPSIGNKLPQKNDRFHLETVTPDKKQNSLLAIELSKIPYKRKHLYLLEVSYSSTKKIFYGENFEDIFNWIDMAHTNIENAFEGCITEKLRDVFNREGE